MGIVGTENPRPAGGLGPAARNWRRDDLVGETDSLSYTLTEAALCQIRDAFGFVAANGLTIDTVEQEDFRLPAFARDVPDLRRRLDTGRGFFVLDGLDTLDLTEPEAEIVGWALCNYLGQPMRQGLGHDTRFFTVADRGTANTDPTRIGASPKRSPKHSDNGCLEPRPPDYIGLLCHRSAIEGGDSTLISAATIYDTVRSEHPEFLPILAGTFHFRSPQAHVWPSGRPTVRMPILETAGGELRIHYARVMIEPGMEMAGTPLAPEEHAALDYLDDVLERPELNFRHRLNPGELLLLNNLVLLHGREAFPAGASGGRTLKRYWMWRRHIGPGTDPVALDLEELG